MVGIWIKLRVGLSGERFPRESQSSMTDIRRIGWEFLVFLWREDFKGMLLKGRDIFFPMCWIW